MKKYVKESSKTAIGTIKNAECVKNSLGASTILDRKISNNKVIAPVNPKITNGGYVSKTNNRKATTVGKGC